MKKYGNRSVLYIILHNTLHNFAYNTSANFFIVYLLVHGFTPSATFLTFSIILVLRLLMRPIMIRIVPVLGTRRTLALGSLLFGLQYIVLAGVDGVNFYYFAYCFLGAVSDIFYWTTYHATFAFVSEDHNRGHSVGLREALFVIVSVLAPLLAGFALDHAGPWVTFIGAALLECIAVIPLLKIPNLKVDVHHKGWLTSSAVKGGLLFVTDAWIVVTLSFVWSIKLFGVSSHGFTSYGGALALAGLFSSIGTFVFGKVIDRGQGLRAVHITMSVLILVVLLYCGVDDAYKDKAIAAGLGSLLMVSYRPTLLTAFYGLANKSSCIFRHILFTESAWDMGALSASLLTSFLLAKAGGTIFPMLTSLVGIVGQRYILEGIYRKSKK